jgi:hypothetical protein
MGDFGSGTQIIMNQSAIPEIRLSGSPDGIPAAI